MRVPALRPAQAQRILGAVNSVAARPCLLVLATGAAAADGAGTALAQTLRRAVESRLPLLVLAPLRLVPAVEEQVPRHDVLVLSDRQARLPVGDLLALGVVERALAPGWLLLPGELCTVQPATVQAVAQALQQHPLAFAQHGGRRGHPLGFAAELFSELLGLQGDDGPRRLLARYPAHATLVDDPGVLGAGRPGGPGHGAAAGAASPTPA